MSEETNKPQTGQELDMSTISAALALVDMEEKLKNIENNIFQYKHQAAIDYISTVLDITKAFTKSFYEKNINNIKTINLKTITEDHIKLAEPIALAILSYTKSTYEQRIMNGELPAVFAQQKVELESNIAKTLEAANQDPALLRNIAVAVKQKNVEMQARQQAQMSQHASGIHTQSTQSLQTPRLKPLPNPELKKVIHSELNKSNLSVVEKPLVNTESLGFKEPTILSTDARKNDYPSHDAPQEQLEGTIEEASNYEKPIATESPENL